jgi:hypothetical protein
MKKLLVIEDSSDEIRKAKEFFSTVSDVEVVYAESLAKLSCLARSLGHTCDIHEYTRLYDERDGEKAWNRYACRFFRTFDYIITDLHIPKERREEYSAKGLAEIEEWSTKSPGDEGLHWKFLFEPAPWGLGIAYIALMAGVPCVVNTDAHHHGSGAWFQSAWSLFLMPLCGGICDTKNWAEAWRDVQEGGVASPDEFAKRQRMALLRARGEGGPNK